MPMELYLAGGQRWMYSSVYYLSVIAVWCLLGSLLALETHIGGYSKACLIFCLEVCFIALFSVCFNVCLREPHVKDGIERCALRKVWSF